MSEMEQENKKDEEQIQLELEGIKKEAAQGEGAGDEARLLRSIEELKQLTSNPAMPIEVSMEEWALLSNQETESLIDMIRGKMRDLGSEAGKVAAAEEIVKQIEHAKRLIAIQRIVWHTKERTLGALLQQLTELQAKEIQKVRKPAARPKAAAAAPGAPRAKREKLSDEEVAIRTMMKYGATREQAIARIKASEAES